MAQLQASLVPQCIGRYVADLPKGFEWREPDVTLYYGKGADFTKMDVEVLVQHTTKAAFDKAVADRKAHLGAVINTETNKSNLLATSEQSGMVTFTTYSDAGYTTGMSHELHEMVGEAHVVIKADSYEGVVNDPKNLSPAVEARMLALAKQIRPVINPEKAGPGFCLGSVVVDSNNDYEHAMIDFTIHRYPDVHFHVSMTNQDNPGDTLHQRLKKIDSLADGRRLTILRSGSTTVAGMPAQEELAKIVEDRTEFQFVVEPRPAQPSFAQEGMQISLDTGVQLADGRYLSSTLTQDEALALWDAIIQSFKPRPDAVRAAGIK